MSWLCEMPAQLFRSFQNLLVMTDEPSHVDGARSLGRIIERDMNIVRENFGTFRACSVGLVLLRSDFAIRAEWTGVV